MELKKLGEMIIVGSVNVAAEKLEIRAEMLRTMARDMDKEATKMREGVKDAIENYKK